MKWKFALTALIVGLLAFAATPLLLHPSPDLVISSTQKAGFIFLIFLESLFFGTGVAFVIFGLRPLKHSRKGLVIPFISVAWLVISWWPHDQLHFRIGPDVGGTLLIDYAFHLPSILAALVLLYHFWHHLKNGSERKDDGMRRGGFEVWK